jgi:hypothetical protein
MFPVPGSAMCFHKLLNIHSSYFPVEKDKPGWATGRRVSYEKKLFKGYI